MRYLGPRGDDIVYTYSISTHEDEPAFVNSTLNRELYPRAGFSWRLI